MSEINAEEGFIKPAEWERHEAVWLSWPQNKEDWPGKFSPIRWVFAEIVRILHQSETVRIAVTSDQIMKRAKSDLSACEVDLGRVEFHRMALNRGWMRDISPQFVRDKATGKISLVRFGFNGWAKYGNWKMDARFPQKVSRTFDLPMIEAECRGRPVILEGGSIDVNGCGTLITTEECLLDAEIQVRNPGLSREDMEEIFASYLGATNVIWLNKGIVGDDTHGHVDDLCRFVDADKVVLCREKNPSDPNYRNLEENFERLQSARLENGSKLQVVELPMPEPVVFQGQRLPASYANFLIANTRVLVPTFNDPNDRVALGIMAGLFPDREVVGICCRDLVWGLGTVHCLTHEHPEG